MDTDLTWLNNGAEIGERLLLDVAGRIQLSQSQYEQAETNYRALADLVDKTKGSLQNRVLEIYPSGSFAIGAAILGQVKKDQHDVDAVLEVDVPSNTDPEWMLRALYDAIRGGPGSRYYDCTSLNSRCVTVTYTDGRTVDLMPVARLNDTPERVANLFHWKPELSEKYHKQVNPFGFAQHFRSNAPRSTLFEKKFRDRIRLLEKAETQPLPGYEPLYLKSPLVVAIQLIKRARDLRYRKKTHSDLRRPPSVILASLSLNVHAHTDDLLQETIAVAQAIRAEIIEADKRGQLVSVRNPTWYADVFTDRWPETKNAQQIFALYLQSLAIDLYKLKSGVLTADQQVTLLREHFGETPATYALNKLYEARGTARATGMSRVAVNSGRVSVASAPEPTQAKRTNFGGEKT